jgi:hypothetical protein
MWLFFLPEVTLLGNTFGGGTGQSTTGGGKVSFSWHITMALEDIVQHPQMVDLPDPHRNRLVLHTGDTE